MCSPTVRVPRLVDRLLALDPSTTRVGWAVFDGHHLTGAGVLTPRRTKDVYLDRIASFVDGVVALVELYEPATVVVEVPSGMAARGSMPGMAGTQAIYGMAVGAVWAVLREVAPSHAVGGGRVATVTEREWTRSVRKERRAALVRLEHPGLDWAADVGMDMADAIGIGRWWMDTQALRRST